MKIKRTLAALLAVLTFAGMTACGEKETKEEKIGSGDAVKAETTAPTETTTAEAASEATTSVPETTAATTTSAAESAPEEEPAGNGEFNEAEIPVIEAEPNPIHEDSINLGLISNGMGRWGYRYDWENDEYTTPTLMDIVVEAKGKAWLWEDNTLVVDDASNGFTFNGTALADWKANEDPETKSETPLVEDRESSVVYVEMDKSESEEDPYITAIAFDINYYDEHVPFNFANTEMEGRDYQKYFRLGDNKADVEAIIGKGYERGSYAFYIGQQATMKVYFIVEYDDNDVVQRVYILNRDLIQ